jgi:N-acetylmuramoyl-L-alanine amidase
MAQRGNISPDIIAGIEQTLNNNAHPDFDIKKILIDKGKKDLVIQVNKVTRKKAKLSYFKDEETEKKRIVLHYTMGQIEGDLSTLTGESRANVSVSYVIGRDGMIYYLFNTQYWSHHLGPGSIGGNAVQSAITIGIELSNVGPLTKVGEEYFMRVDIGDDQFKDLFYCKAEETDVYQVLEQPFKGAKVYATYPEAQYDALIRLLRYLTALWDIPRAFLPEADRFKTSEKVLSFKGIVTHVNYRPEDKSDIGPAFDWKKLIAGVTADTYESTQPTERGGLEAIRVVKSERGIRSSKGAARGVFTEPEED